MNEVIKFPYKEKNSLRSKLIDALLEIRLSLSIKKLVSPTIAKNDFKKLLDETKQKFKDVKVALDEVFEEYFPTHQKNDNKIEFPEFNREEPVYEEGAEKGVSMVKRDKHFNSSGTNSTQSEAS